MIPELGHYALVLALGLALIQGTVPLVGARMRDAALIGVARPAALAQFGFVATAFAALILCHVTSDFSVANAVRVYYKPLVLLIWLGAVVMACGGALSLSDRRLRVGAPKPARPRAVVLQPAE